MICFVPSRLRGKFFSLSGCFLEITHRHKPKFLGYPVVCTSCGEKFGGDSAVCE